MSNLKPIPGKFVWFEHVSKDAKKAQAFYGEVLGWQTRPFPMGPSTYEMICLGDSLDSMIGGYAAPTDDRQPAHWISYLSVENVDAAARATSANGGRVIAQPFDIPTVGRIARVADPQGAELSLFKNEGGDPPDGIAPNGGWVWNELHTSDPLKALAFYEAVIGYTHTSMNMGPDESYHVLGRDGTDRAGVTSLFQKGAPPHWLPYVSVDDVDATIARARRLGATIPMDPADIPDVGRLCPLIDPTGAPLAVLKPLPRAKTR
jgi:predicted enzyme related to lactoylglutathione lyase